MCVRAARERSTPPTVREGSRSHLDVVLAGFGSDLRDDPQLRPGGLENGPEEVRVDAGGRKDGRAQPWRARWGDVERHFLDLSPVLKAAGQYFGFEEPF